MLQGKKVLLGVTGSIAAYKTPELVRQLVQQGAEVKVILTASAADFVSPLVLSTVSKNQVLQSFTTDDQSKWINHVELGLWCDVFLIAPVSANTLAKLTHGICDNLLTAVFLSCRSAVMLAPAMDVDMFRHESTQNNLQQLAKRGIGIIGPESGSLASGLTGLGRMTEPEDIVKAVRDHFNPNLPLKNFSALVTAGPTYEAIDPVRYIGNHSSGKMGVALANELCKNGASVILVCGPGVATAQLNKAIHVIKVISADDMLQVCLSHQSQNNIVIMAAAVADFKPDHAAKHKIKKSSKEGIALNLIPTTDIAAELGKKKPSNQVLIGFALETNDAETNAVKKLNNKNLDFIVLNKLDQDNYVFNSDFNQITIIDKSGRHDAYERKTKESVAAIIVQKITTLVQ
jgi:phosphopantothenoylcysteine decarboxylase/phosphopantothenate--cysteine ligase